MAKTPNLYTVLHFVKYKGTTYSIVTLQLTVIKCDSKITYTQDHHYSYPGHKVFVKKWLADTGLKSGYDRTQNDNEVNNLIFLHQCLLVIA